MAKRTSGKIAVVLVIVLAAAGMGLAWVYYQGQVSPPVDGKGDPATAVTKTELSDQERAAYLKDHVVLDGLAIVPDTKPGMDEPVPGLKRVTGTIRNNGPTPLKVAHVTVFPKNADGEVLGSYIENVLKKGGPLAPGESRDFFYRIPDKPDFAGEFGHKLW